MSKQHNKRELFEDEEERQNGFTVNRKFASKYEQLKAKQDTMRAMRLPEYSDNSDGSDYSSSSADEDSDAELLTADIEHKIMDTLTKIKKKDPLIYEPDVQFFEDEVNDRDQSTATSNDKKLTYKQHAMNILSKEGADAFDDEEVYKPRRTPRQEQDDARNAFKMAALASKSGFGAAVESDDEDVLVVKKKSAEELEKERIESAKFDAKRKTKKRKTDAEVTEDYWAEEKLNDDEQFLKDFITNQRWKDNEGPNNSQKSTSQQKSTSKKSKDDTLADEYDSALESDHLEAVDEFERTYNFRFEEAGSSQVVGHSRIAGDSARIKDDKRKRKRDDVKERKDAMKLQKQEELKRLKNIKKQEIANRLKQIAEATGANVGGTGVDVEKILDTEFNPETYDQEMQDFLGDDYYEEEDQAYAPDGSYDHQYQQEYTEEQTGQVDHEAGVHDEQYDEQEPENEWLLCDACEEPIEPGKRFYECKTCPDYLVCGACERRTEHPHKLRRDIVPENFIPPADWKQKKAAENDALDEVFALDFEDVIADGIATRFKYIKVEPNGFGLNADEIINKPDRYLNKKASLKKIAPYKN